MRIKRAHILMVPLLLMLLSLSAVAAPETVRLLKIASSINPVTAAFLTEQIAAANRLGKRRF